MKLVLCAIPLSLWPLGSLEAAAPAITACNVTVSVTDPDPVGSNVRKTPAAMSSRHYGRRASAATG